MSEFVFPDSGIKVEIERVSYMAVEMLTTSLQERVPHKPSVPQKEIKDGAEVVERIDLPLDIALIQEAIDNPKTSEKDKSIYQSDLETVKQYLLLKNKWDEEVLAVRWQMIRLLYAKHLRSDIDMAAVERTLAESAELGVDLRSQVLALYAKHSVPFDEKWMNAWLYLWTVCVQSASDSGALSVWMSRGSKEALQAARQSAMALF